jgi:asparagine synthase (glutamine-hydrolysing)
MRRVLPARILDRPKVGFRVPVNDWFRTTWRDLVVDSLTDPASLTRAILRPDFIRSVLSQHIEGRRNHEKLLWSLLTLEMFRREYGLALAEPARRAG